MTTEEEKAGNITSGPAWPITVTLGRPVEFGKETVAELVFQRGTLGMLKGVNVVAGEIPPMETLMLIASRLCGQPLKVIETLDPDDSGEVLAIALGFIGRCQSAGKKPPG